MTSTTLAGDQTLTAGTHARAPEVLLRGVQLVLALLFMFAGAMKLITPSEVLQAQSGSLSVPLLRFIGVCEVLGAPGLVLPGLFRIRQVLTPLAAAGLTIIMAGAVVLTALDDVSMAWIPLVVGLLTAFVTHARWRRLPR